MLPNIPQISRCSYLLIAIIGLFISSFNPTTCVSAQQYYSLSGGLPGLYPSIDTPQINILIPQVLNLCQNGAAYTGGNYTDWNMQWVLPSSFTPVNFDIVDWLNYSSYQYSREFQQFSTKSLTTPGIGNGMYLPSWSSPVPYTWQTQINGIKAFTAPMFPGVLWNLFYLTQNISTIQDFGVNNIMITWNKTSLPGYDFRRWANIVTDTVQQEAVLTNTHDIGFTFTNANLLGWKVTGNYSLLTNLRTAVVNLASRFVQVSGLIRSWPNSNLPGSTGQLVIIDNMMNLELLWWSSQYFNNQTWFDMAFSHANRTMYEHFRLDNSTWHVVEYNDTTGTVKRKVTSQGYADNSTWARGQAWVTNYNDASAFLEKSLAAADLFLNRVSQQSTFDSVSFWDFDAPLNVTTRVNPKVNTYQLRDSSASAIVAAGLLESITFLDDEPIKQQYYYDQARYILNNLTQSFTLRGHPEWQLPAILAHGTSNWPSAAGIDVALCYGDYYFVEALKRLYFYEQNQIKSLSQQTLVATNCTYTPAASSSGPGVAASSSAGDAASSSDAAVSSSDVVVSSSTIVSSTASVSSSDVAPSSSDVAPSSSNVAPSSSVPAASSSVPVASQSSSPQGVVAVSSSASIQYSSSAAGTTSSPAAGVVISSSVHPASSSPLPFASSSIPSTGTHQLFCADDIPITTGTTSITFNSLSLSSVEDILFIINQWIKTTLHSTTTDFFQFIRCSQVGLGESGRNTRLSLSLISFDSTNTITPTFSIDGSLQTAVFLNSSNVTTTLSNLNMNIGTLAQQFVSDVNDGSIPSIPMGSAAVGLQSPLVLQQQQDQGTSSSTLSGGAIAGVVIGIVVFVGLLIALILYYRDPHRNYVSPSIRGNAKIQAPPSMHSSPKNGVQPSP